MSSVARRDVFQAIADPTRRQIINLLAHQSMNLNALAENFNISRPAVSQHIKFLKQCGMVEVRRQGREHYCQAKLDQLNEVAGWVEQYKVFWNEKLNSLDKYLSKIQNKRKTKIK